MKFLTARFDDMCLTCGGKIHKGDLIRWEQKHSHHAECDTGVVGKWLKNGKK